MPLQYLLDYTGKTTAVLIPISEWVEITKKHQDLKSLETLKPMEKLKPSDFKGILSKDEAELFQHYLIEARKEWDRDIY